MSPDGRASCARIYLFLGRVPAGPRDTVVNEFVFFSRPQAGAVPGPGDVSSGGAARAVTAANARLAQESGPAPRLRLRARKSLGLRRRQLPSWPRLLGRAHVLGTEWPPAPVPGSLGRPWPSDSAPLAALVMRAEQAKTPRRARACPEPSLGPTNPSPEQQGPKDLGLAGPETLPQIGRAHV